MRGETAESLGYKTVNLLPGLGAGGGFGGFSGAEEDECGDGLDAVLCGDGWAIVRIDAAEFGAGDFVRCGIKDGCERAAGGAPGGKKVDQHGFLRVQNLLAEGVFGKRNDHDGFSFFA